MRAIFALCAEAVTLRIVVVFRRVTCMRSSSCVALSVTSLVSRDLYRSTASLLPAQALT